VAVLANGMAGHAPIESEDDPRYEQFYEKLEEMCIHLAKLIVSDGEGSSKFVEYEITGAADDRQARQVARAVSSSALVKTAMFGRDPNWGRIICAGGNAGVPFDYRQIDLYLGDAEQQVQVLEKGRPLPFDRNKVKRLLRESHLTVRMNMNGGKGRGIAWGADLTTDYVMFNSVYTT
jgi:glutamate N-acetyltransferase/amino-acid N-acetyltransferase